MQYEKQHTIHALAHNQPGVLNKLFSLLRRKRYNVEGITAGHTNVPGISRMTITFSHEEGTRIDQIVRQVQKITEVTYAEDVTEGDVFIHELAMLKVKANAKNRADIIRTAETMRGRVLHIGLDFLIIEIAGSRGRIQNALEVFADIGVLDIARTGQVALDRDGANPPDSYGM